jgi:protein-tyrosine phosphatase
MSYVDLHLHLLPGVDDGPPDLPASIDFAAELVAAGVREVTVTPHVAHARFPLDVATIGERTAALQTALGEQGIALRLHPGGEIHPSGAADLGADDLDAVAQGPSGARWVLLEVPFVGILIAHPERASGLLDGGLSRVRAEMAAGAVLQVSVCSLLGRHGNEARVAAEYLVRTGLAYVLASDGHGGARNQTLAQGTAAARAAGASALHAWQLTQANPGFLLRHGIAPEPTRPVRAWNTRADRRLLAARGAARRFSAGR